MNEIVKICKKHGELTGENAKFRKDRNYYECKLCIKVGNNKYYSKNKENHKIMSKKWRDGNSEKMKNYYLSYYKNNLDKYDEKQKRRKERGYFKDYGKRIRESLSDKYIKTLIQNTSTLKFCEIPDSLVEVSRVLLMLKRKLKEMKDVDKNNG